MDRAITTDDIVEAILDACELSEDAFEVRDLVDWSLTGEPAGELAAF